MVFCISIVLLQPTDHATRSTTLSPIQPTSTHVFPFTHTHSYTAHQEQLRVQYLAQGHFDMQLGGSQGFKSVTLWLLDDLGPCPHVPKQSFFPLSSSTSFQLYLRPNWSTVNDSTHCSSYSSPINGAWNSPKTEKKRWSMRIKLAHCIQIDSRRRIQKEEEDKND